MKWSTKDSEDVLRQAIDHLVATVEALNDLSRMEESDGVQQDKRDFHDDGCSYARLAEDLTLIEVLFGGPTAYRTLPWDDDLPARKDLKEWAAWNNVPAWPL